jgi:hypothetical protein
MASFLDTLNPEKTGIILIEFQNDFTSEGEKNDCIINITIT